MFNNNKKNHLCLNCIYPNKFEPELPRCDTVGVLGIAAGLTGLIAAQIALNFFTKDNRTENKLITISAKSLLISKIIVKKNKHCLNIN